MIERVISVETAFREGLQHKEMKQPPLPSPIKQRYSFDNSFMSESGEEEEESLLHQLRREEYDKNQLSFYHDENGQYNLSMDDSSSLAQSSMLFSPAIDRSYHGIPPPPKSRLSLQRSSLSDASYLGDLPILCMNAPFLLNCSNRTEEVAS